MHRVKTNTLVGSVLSNPSKAGSDTTRPSAPPGQPLVFPYSISPHIETNIDKTPSGQTATGCLQKTKRPDAHDFRGRPDFIIIIIACVSNEIRNIFPVRSLDMILYIVFC